jgi:hypothetical protein
LAKFLTILHSVLASMSSRNKKPTWKVSAKTDGPALMPPKLKPKQKQKAPKKQKPIERGLDLSSGAEGTGGDGPKLEVE